MSTPEEVSTQTTPLPDYPKWYYHRQVAAFKIEAVEPQPDGTVKLIGEGCEAVVDSGFIDRSIPNTAKGVSSFIGQYYAVFPPNNLGCTFYGDYFEQEYFKP